MFYPDCLELLYRKKHKIFWVTHWRKMFENPKDYWRGLGYGTKATTNNAHGTITLLALLACFSALADNAQSMPMIQSDAQNPTVPTLDADFSEDGIMAVKIKFPAAAPLVSTLC